MKNSVWLIFLILTPCSAFSQSEIARQFVEADFNIFFKQDFENTPVGIYTLSQWNKDWNRPEGGSVCAFRTLIVDQTSGGRNTRCMKWVFPENSHSVNADYGYDWQTPIGETLEEVYLSFSIMFKPGFHAASGGKIPGVEGTPPGAMNRPEWDQGFGGSLMFKAERNNPDNPPSPTFYVYHQDQELIVGDSPRWDYVFDVSTETWYDITYRIVMNTATATGIGGPDGLRDGIMEGFVNGRLCGQITDLRLRNLVNIGIDKIRIQGFFGGGDNPATVRDEWMMIDNVHAWTYSDEYLRNNPSVKRGRQSNQPGASILTPTGNVKIKERYKIVIVADNTILTNFP
jgi:hypothetical protein